MEASFVPKRPFGPSASAIDRQFDPPTPTASSSAKRRHHPSPLSSSNTSHPSVSFRGPTHSLKLASGSALFRILCPASKTGSVIGKGGAIIRQFREETGARIRIDDSVPGCEERVISIVADSAKREVMVGKPDSDNAAADSIAEESINPSYYSDGASPAQLALFRVFERILKVDEERSGPVETEIGEDKKEGNNGGGVRTAQGPVVCRLLAPNNQVGCVLGRGGKIVERIRHDSGAQVRVLPPDHIPACAHPGDELIQISGSFSAVRKALLAVSGCLQDNPKADCATSKSSSTMLRGTGTENFGANHRMVLEEEIVFKLLCQVDKVGSLIGKGGSIIRTLQNETGASIKVADAATDLDETVVVISARENSEQRHSPAQDAVIRVQSRIAEIGFEPGALVVARLLVHSQQVRAVFGKGDIIITDLRRATGANIRIFPKEQSSKYGSQQDEVVQVVGSLQSVQDALFQITSWLRETVFPLQRHLSNYTGSTYMSPYPEMPPPSFRPRHEPPSPAGLPRGMEHAIASQSLESRPAFSRSMDRFGSIYLDHNSYSYGTDRPGYGPSIDRQSSPGGWNPQVVGGGNSVRVADVGDGFTPIPIGRNQAFAVASTTFEVVIPQILLSYVYGECNSNLAQIRQISGANVVIHDPSAGATEGVAVISGTPDQARVAQILIQACILSELKP